MSRKITTIAVTGIAALSLAAAGAAWAAGAPSASSHTLKFTSVQTASVGEKNFADSDKDVRNRKVIGYDVADGTYHSKTKTITVTVAAALNGGILYLSGTGDVTNGRFTGKITGGTGVFKGVHGSVSGQATGKHGQNEKLVIVYH